MKKTNCMAVVAIAMAVMLAGCGNNEQSQEKLGEKQTPTQAQKDQVTRQFLSQGDGTTIRKMGSNPIKFGGIVH